jgi:hypothetical protein
MFEDFFGVDVGILTGEGVLRVEVLTLCADWALSCGGKKQVPSDKVGATIGSARDETWSDWAS